MQWHRPATGVSHAFFECGVQDLQLPDVQRIQQNLACVASEVKAEHRNRGRPSPKQASVEKFRFMFRECSYGERITKVRAMPIDLGQVGVGFNVFRRYIISNEH